MERKRRSFKRWVTKYSENGCTVCNTWMIHGVGFRLCAWVMSTVDVF